jgi:hypothetical protein
MKKLYLSSLLAPLCLFLTPGSTSAYPLTGSISIDYTSEYVFRGTTLAGSAIQPGAEIGFGNFTTGVWVSTAIGKEGASFGDEVDLYARYAFSLGSISADVGATVYHYPQSGGLFDFGTGVGDASTFEVYGSLGFEGPLSPGLSAYYDLTLEALTMEASAGYSYEITVRTDINLNGSAGLVTIANGTDYQYGSASADLSWAFSEKSAAYIGLNLGLSSEDTFADIEFDPRNPLSIGPPSSSSIWFGIGFSSAF